MGETAQDKFNREKQEYEDAINAYRIILQSISGNMPSPESMTSAYAPEVRGWERMGPGTWIAQKHPELAKAAQRVKAEEQDFLALDDPSASYVKDNCSISAYVGDKFYEYVAMLETIYLLASDAAFREQVLAKLESGFLANILTVIGATYGADSRHMAGLFNEDIRKRNIELDQAGREAAARAVDQIKEAFANAWSEIKENYHNCGLGNAIVKAGVDGAFLVGEMAVGAGALKALKLVARVVRLPSGLAGVKVSIQGFASSKLAANAKIADILASVDGKTFGFDALEAKYGKPGDNHVGGELPDTNRPLPDKSAEEMLREKRAADEAESKRTKPIRPRKELDCFEMPRNIKGNPAREAEFRRQLKEQQDTINNMTSDEMAYAHVVLDQARNAWRAQGKTGAGTDLIRGDGAAQKAARAEFAEQLRRQGLSKSEIASRMAKLDATHFLDLIAGGDPNKVGMGGSAANQAIGPAWSRTNSTSGVSRAGQLRSEAEAMRAAGLAQDKMNIGLSACP